MLIHIGYPKTGSSWLQRYLFDGTLTRLLAVPPRSDIRRMLIAPLPLWYDAEEMRRHLNACKRQAEELGMTTVPVVPPGSVYQISNIGRIVGSSMFSLL